MVNYEEAIKKPFTDIKKLVIGIILSLIPIVNFTVVTGFAIESSGLGKTKPSKKMPEWKDWMSLFMRGLGALAIKIIYLLPAFLVIAIGIGLAMGDVASTLLGTVVTPEVMSQLQAGETTPMEIREMLGGNWYLILPTILKFAPILLVSLLLLLVGGFLTPMAVLNYVKNKRFSAAFELSTVVKKTLTSKYILAWLVVLILGAILGAILSLVPLVGPAAALFVIGVFSYSLYGQVYKKV